MFIAFLSSISKVAIVAFLFTFIAILIELYLISRKDKVKKEKKDVVLPEFTEGTFKPLDNVKNSPLAVKKAAIDRAPHEMSAKYVVGLISLCAIVFIGVAMSIVFKGNQDQIVDQAPLPTRPARPTAAVRISPTTSVSDNDEVAIMTLDDETSSGEAGILAQAPSPTTFLPTTVPTKVITLVPTVIITTTIATPTSSALSATPTKATTPTLLKTGTHYNASLIAAVISFALIAFAFMF
jgi:hypothetical protein